MNIETTHAQINVKDSEGIAGANINRRASGYVADIHFWGKAIYVARRKGDDSLHILIAPSERWKEDIEAEEFEILGKLSDFPNTCLSHGDGGAPTKGAHLRTPPAPDDPSSLAGGQ
jgi:hypothetical protein